jgi:hypothetical protein
MSKLARALILGATLAAMNLAGLTAVAYAQANDDPDGKDARRLATERQAGESWRQGQVASQEQAAAAATLRRVLARERFSIPSGTPAQVPAPVPAESDGPPGWLLASLGVLAAAPTWQPHRLAGDRLLAYSHGIVSVHQEGRALRAHPLAPDARQ